MKKNRRFDRSGFIIYQLLLLMSACLLITCDTRAVQTKTVSKNDPAENDTQYEVATKRWVTDKEGFVQFYTNDKIMNRPWGSTYWHPLFLSGQAAYELIVDTNKISGNATYGYGVIFCIQDDPGPELFVARNFYALLINTYGLYQVIKVVDGQQYSLAIEGADKNGWVKAVNQTGDFFLNKGMNTINTVKVVARDDNLNDIPEFSFYLNGNLTYQFEENFSQSQDGSQTFDLFNYTAGKNKYGFMITMSPAEDFPYIPVDVRFKMTTPQLPLVQKQCRSGLFDYKKTGPQQQKSDLFLSNSDYHLKVR